MSHTPGPWRLSYSLPTDQFVVLSDGSPQGSVARIDVSQSSVLFAQIEPNARLIAAAPELLDALKEVAHHADDECGFMVQVKAAIAKAEGR